MSVYTTKDLSETYGKYCGEAIAECRLTRQVVGGVPASKDGIKAFVIHHLHIAEGPEADAAVARIMNEEVGERDTPQGEGEIKEKESYGLNVIRRDEFGPFLGDWQFKAALKQAASRVGLFMSKRGTKGDMAEMGKVSAYGVSLHGPEYKVYLMDPMGTVPASTYYQKFMGRVSTPSGAKSIVNDAECAPEGSRFGFRFQWYNGKLTEADVVKIFSALPVVGIGSVKSLECGKFDIERLEITIPKSEKKSSGESE